MFRWHGLVAMIYLLAGYQLLPVASRQLTQEPRFRWRRNLYSALRSAGMRHVRKSNCVYKGVDVLHTMQRVSNKCNISMRDLGCVFNQEVKRTFKIQTILQ
jgi:hypothetical protein